jgi:Flp pilus assembly protein protease CpaA
VTIAFAILLVAILGALTWFDIRQMILPDELNAALGLSGLTYQWLSSADTLALQLGFSAATLAVFG